MKYILILSTLLLASTALANNGADFPPDEVVTRAIEEHPQVQAALARADAARQNAVALRAGPYEFAVNGSYNRRNIDREGQYDEYDATLERPIRLPGKASLDRKAGDFGIAASDYRVADVRHRTTLLVSDLWLDWLSAEAEVKIALAAVGNLSSALQGVERQVALQDAAVADADRARAALATAQVELEQSSARAEIAKSRLTVQFPSLALPQEAPVLPVPVLPMQSLEGLRDVVMVQNHEVPGAQAEADRQSTLSARANKDRIPDPTIGLRLFSERGGAERGIGVVTSIPFGGRYRSGLAGQAEAEARAASAELIAARFTAQEAATSDYVEASNNWRAWQSSQAARSSSESAAFRLQEGYRLGGVDLTDLLYAERQAQDAARAESAARAAALRSITRLRIDAHDLWPDGHDKGKQQ